MERHLPAGLLLSESVVYGGLGLHTGAAVDGQHLSCHIGRGR